MCPECVLASCAGFTAWELCPDRIRPVNGQNDSSQTGHPENHGKVPRELKSPTIGVSTILLPKRSLASAFMASDLRHKMTTKSIL